jgi:sugar phosphate isomerase/epimerase
MIKIGNAPVSYDAFEVTVGKHDSVPATEVLDAVAAAGYDGIDLGPVGFLSLGCSLRTALETGGLLLIGGYVEVDVSADDEPTAGLAELARTRHRTGSTCVTVPGNSSAIWCRHVFVAPAVRR